MAISILLAEDMNMVRGALVALLDLESDMNVICQLERGDEIVPSALEHKPDIAIIDIDLPGLDGLSAAAQLRGMLPECRTLILTNLDRPGTLRRAMDAKVSGYLLKDAPAHELASAVRRVAAGQRVVAPQLAIAALERGDNPMTARETDILRLTAEGAEPAAIAQELGLSPGTVRNYLTSIVTRLGARNRVDAIRIAREEGWML